MGLGAWGTKATAEPTMATRAVAERTRILAIAVGCGVGRVEGGEKLGKRGNGRMDGLDGWTALFAA